MNHPDDIALISLTGDITIAPPPKTGLVCNFKFAYSPADFFKKCIKRDASLFTNFKEGKYWDAWSRNALATARAQDATEALNPDYSPVTAYEVNLFKEKQKFMHAVFDKKLKTDRGKTHVREHEG